MFIIVQSSLYPKPEQPCDNLKNNSTFDLFIILEAIYGSSWLCQKLGPRKYIDIISDTDFQLVLQMINQVVVYVVRFEDSYL